VRSGSQVDAILEACIQSDALWYACPSEPRRASRRPNRTEADPEARISRRWMIRGGLTAALTGPVVRLMADSCRRGGEDSTASPFEG
jgi:hypothetical protein